MDYYSAIEKNYQALKKEGDILKAYYQVKMIFSLISTTLYCERAKLCHRINSSRVWERGRDEQAVTVDLGHL